VALKNPLKRARVLATAATRKAALKPWTETMMKKISEKQILSYTKKLINIRILYLRSSL
jgi:hypothetical protein